MQLRFDAKLVGADGLSVPVYCKVDAAYVGGQGSNIEIFLPSQFATPSPPKNPCHIESACGSTKINIDGIYWQTFPGNKKSAWGLEKIDLIHIEKLIIEQRFSTPKREIRFHLAPLSYLRSKSSMTTFNSKTHQADIFQLKLPSIGKIKFVTSWETVHHQDTESPGATINAGFDAVAKVEASIAVEDVISKFKESIEILSVLFRQAVTVHGWTTTGEVLTTTWINPTNANATKSALELRGDHLAPPGEFVKTANKLTKAYAEADTTIKSMVRHISLAVNPYVAAKPKDRFLFMFTALERLIDAAWTMDKSPHSPTAATEALKNHLKKLKDSVKLDSNPNSKEISERLQGLIGLLNRPSIRDKYDALLRVYPTMKINGADLWPVIGKSNDRGLKDVRDSLAHGASALVAIDVIALAEWHLSILLERLIFVLLGLPVPAGAAYNSPLLRQGGKGWYERNRWEPLRSKPDIPI